MSEEIWRPIAGWEDLYEVSDKGRVRSLPRAIEVMTRWGFPTTRHLRGKVLAPSANTSGYLKVTLYRDTYQEIHFLHKLVLEAFVGPRPAGMQGCHGKRGKLCNDLSNLRWDTPSANQADREAHGTAQRGKRRSVLPFTQREVDFIRRNRGKMTRTAMAKVLGRNRTSVNDIASGRTWAGGVNGRQIAS